MLCLHTAGQIPNARHTLLTGIGHYPMEELDTMADLLDAWLRAFPARAG